VINYSGNIISKGSNQIITVTLSGQTLFIVA